MQLIALLLVLFIGIKLLPLFFGIFKFIIGWAVIIAFLGYWWKRVLYKHM